MAIGLAARIGASLGRAVIRAVSKQKNSGGNISPSVYVEIDDRNLEALLKRKANDIVSDIERSLLKTAQYGTQIIIDRTERGIGYLLWLVLILLPSGGRILYIF